jgi:hypothetical protein
VILESLVETESRNVGDGSILFKLVKPLFSCLLRVKPGGSPSPLFEVGTTVQFSTPLQIQLTMVIINYTCRIVLLNHSSGAQIFQESRNHLKILSTTTVH